MRSENGEQTVLVLDGKKLTRRPVTLGIGDGANVIVTSGLHEGEQVVRSITLSENSEESESSFHMGPPERKKRE